MREISDISLDKFPAAVFYKFRCQKEPLRSLCSKLENSICFNNNRSKDFSHFTKLIYQTTVK